jgi:hypothetical protein
VLSGTGSDGTLGVRAVKGEGGMVMAQTPQSTEYDGMPRSAIATGLVDFVLPAAEMPAQLIAYVAHAFGKTSLPVSPQAPSPADALKKDLSPACAPKPVTTFPNTNATPSSAASSGVWPSTRSSGWKTMSAILQQPRPMWRRSFATF